VALISYVILGSTVAELWYLYRFREAAERRETALRMNGGRIVGGWIEPWERLHTESLIELQDGARKLGKLRSKAAIPHLIAELRKTRSAWYHNVRDSCLDSIERIGRAAIPAILEELRCHKEANDAPFIGCESLLHGELMGVLMRMGRKAEAAVQTVIWHARQSGIRATVYPNGAIPLMQEVFVLCHIADRPAPVLLALVADDEPEILRYSAAAMLWRIGESVEAERALEILEKETECSALSERTGALLERIRTGERPPPMPTP
jgi:hypothetical protein